MLNSALLPYFLIFLIVDQSKISREIAMPHKSNKYISSQNPAGRFVAVYICRRASGKYRAKSGQLCVPARYFSQATPHPLLLNSWVLNKTKS
jgi:hypothetical protein